MGKVSLGGLETNSRDSVSDLGARTASLKRTPYFLRKYLMILCKDSRTNIMAKGFQTLRSSPLKLQIATWISIWQEKSVFKREFEQTRTTFYWIRLVFLGSVLLPSL
ncbi:hypothetical protein EYC80_002367 [Monilinia laxa]|uniref:Uncharacterized protein n=1 Tax=Monilinia laxa TaxID=61186 RepID=A0A5N6K3R5_MONLA|nr:hypothetical protein EYC80_002367 [Monilinia laxa]